MNDPYGIDIVPRNIFENQIVSRWGTQRFKIIETEYMATIRVLSLGTNFIPKWRDPSLKHTFKNSGISIEECKTACFSRKLLRERIVWTINLI